jgi:hypothetical protein
MEGDGVLGRRETERGAVPVNAALGDVIGSLCADKEAITTKHGIGGERGALCSKSESEEKVREEHTNLEDVQNGAGVQTGLLVGSAKKHRLAVFLRVENGGGLELEAVSDLVLELDLGADNVGGGPGLSEGKAVTFVGIFAL